MILMIEKEQLKWQVISAIYDMKFNIDNLDDYFEKNVDKISEFIVTYGEESFHQYILGLEYDASMKVISLIWEKYNNRGAFQLYISNSLLLI